MDPYLSYAREHLSDIKSLIGELVACESPTGDPAAVKRFVDLVASRASDCAVARTIRCGEFGPILRLKFKLPGRRKQGQIMALGHADTVWPVGTLATMPFKEADGRLWGPGVFDMKCGIAFFLLAMRALRDLDTPVARNVVLQLNSDEEVGSPSSRPHTEAEARRSLAVLVMEPALGLDGRLKTARKGAGEFRVAVRGKAAHSGVDFAAGASAVVELARQIERIAAFTNLDKGITVNPGVVQGGTRSNVVAESASVECDVRVWRAGDGARIERLFRKLKPFDKRCTIAVEGGVTRPPLERTPAVAKLVRLAQKLAREIGVELEEASTGGGSDGNFTAALGIPTLDGLGGVGEALHAPNESILVDRIADRVALTAKLVAAL
ncbi:MAG: M20 family metallopeptidase [Acidobacteriales bacterium]|nr:M20 family metallopeptidase [Terriglobales bacterium]